MAKNPEPKVEQEQDAARDSVLRRMLKTPPKPKVGKAIGKKRESPGKPRK